MNDRRTTSTAAWLIGLVLGLVSATALLAQEKSVRPDINKEFQDPEVKKWIERFEREGRDVFDKRKEIIEACKLKPGTFIADIGAGTGLFTRMLAPQVGPEGRVYAVDISPKFLDHVKKICGEQGLKNVVPAVCKPESVELPPNSIDVAFICDTYHHFEYPEKTMRSIHRALRPGGQVILVEFHRIEGVSSKWVMEHVRADQKTFADEIVAAGFKVVGEEKFLKESYFMRFAKVQEEASRAVEKTPAPADLLKGKKLIEWGWDEPDTKFIRANIERMEQFQFDGLIFHVTSSKGGNLVWEMWGSRKFELDEFTHAIEDLNKTQFRRFTDRFLRVNVTPGNVDWFNDAAWATVLHNFSLATRIAKESKTRGFMFDVEQYNSALFDYGKLKDRDSRSFAEYRAKLRERGQQWIRAVNEVYPDITILLTFGYSIAQPRGGAKDRSGVHYGLLADFLDGIFDACSERTVIVDAWESAYPYKRHAQFEEAYQTIKTKGLEWSANPEKYLRHVRAGFGIWMDQDWRRKGWDLKDFTKNHFTPAEFEYSVHCALRTSDDYVWIYTEQPRWWTNERLPQPYVEALKNARQPRAIDDAAQRR